MGARGRKSAAELTTISASGIAVTRRPDPPDHLSDDAADIWRHTVNSVPADWIALGALPLLESLCSLTASARLVQQAIEVLEHGAAEDFDRDEWSRLLRQHGELSGRIATLATRLRLTPQSRYGPRQAARLGNERPGPRPWD